jgi:hypothetical protein
MNAKKTELAAKVLENGNGRKVVKQILENPEGTAEITINGEHYIIKVAS